MFAEALWKVHGARPLFDRYFDDAVRPFLLAQRRPPLLAGFAAYLAMPAVQEARSACLQEALRRQPTLLDLDPPLFARFAALGGVQAGARAGNRPAADTCLDRPDDCERALLAFRMRREAVAGFPLMPWSQLGAMWVQRWREQWQALGAARPQLRTAELADALATARWRWQTGTQIQPRAAHRGIAEQAAVHAVGLGLALLLLAHGYVAHAAIGERPVLAHGAERLDPFALARGLARDPQAARDDRARLAALGLPPEAELGAGLW